jgi:hypothetical protein
MNKGVIFLILGMLVLSACGPISIQEVDLDIVEPLEDEQLSEEETAFEDEFIEDEEVELEPVI